MSVAVDVAWSEDKAAAELKRIGADFVLAESAGLCAFPRDGVIGSQHVENIRGLQSCNAVGAPVGINQQRKRDAGLLAKQPRMIGVGQSDDGHFRAAGLEFVLVIAQLRDVLAAEDSPVMTEEGDDRRVGLP